jgi:hypothetical protein
MRQSITVLVAIVGVMLAAAGVLAKEHTPSGTVRLHGKSVSAGIGVSWGKGTLHYKGKNYSFEIEGLSVGGVGASEIDATGEVYHLNKLDDFVGTYASGEAGATIGGGGEVAVMKNARGVEMRLRATTRGVELKLGPEGLKVKR